MGLSDGDVPNMLVLHSIASSGINNINLVLDALKAMFPDSNLYLVTTTLFLPISEYRTTLNTSKVLPLTEAKRPILIICFCPS